MNSTSTVESGWTLMRFDLADVDAGDADEVSAFQPGHVDELRPVGLLGLETELTEDSEQANAPSTHTTK